VRNLSKTEEDQYSYPDIDDKITFSLIQEKESFKDQWADSEKEILNKIKKYLKGTPHSWLLDAGCGTGRLLPEFQNYFNHILAVDPDASQIEKAKILVKNQGLSKKITFEITPIEMLKWKKKSLDVTLCSHVIQHMHTDLVRVVFKKFNELSKADGLLFILSAHSQEKDYYVKDFLEEGKFCEEIINRSEFNSIVVNKKSILPIHFFSLDALQTQLRKSGYEVIDSELFHWLGNSKPHVLSARDILLVCQKIGEFPT
jgi:ubiquinone/menaquinone biosynthesis C-methylase UbiE